MDKSFKRAETVYNVLMTLVFAPIFTFLSQFLSTGKFNLAQGSLSIIVVGAVAFAAATFLPAPKWGMKLAGMLGLKPDSFAAGLLISIIFSAIMVLVLSPSGAIFGMVIMGGLPLPLALSTCFNGWWILYLAGMALSMIAANPLRKLSMRICQCPVPKR